jgi:transposase
VTAVADDGTSDDKKSGYKRAPGDGRFKPSGNPHGRPKGSRNLRTELKEVMSETVVIRENGKRRRVSGQRAMLMRLRQIAIDGDTRAIVKMIDTQLKLDPTTTSEDQAEEILPQKDSDLIAAFLRDATPSKTGEPTAQTTTPSECSFLAVGDRTAAESDGVHTDLDARISAEHPLRRLRDLADAAMRSLDAEFGAETTTTVPTISPDKLVRTWLLRLFYSISNEALLVDELGYNRVYRWFVGLRIDEPAQRLVKFTETLNSLYGGQFIRRFRNTFFTNNDVKVFLFSEVSFSVLTRLAEWHGYLPRRAVAAEDDVSAIEE